MIREDCNRALFNNKKKVHTNKSFMHYLSALNIEYSFSKRHCLLSVISILSGFVISIISTNSSLNVVRDGEKIYHSKRFKKTHHDEIIYCCMNNIKLKNMEISVDFRLCFGPSLPIHNCRSTRGRGKNSR